jgi:hypothetical protein
MIRLKSLVEQKLDTTKLDQALQPYVQSLNQTYNKEYSFTYVGKSNDKLYFEAELNPDFGDLNLIVGEAFMEARLHIKENKCNFEIFYTLTGLEEFSASVGKVVKENDKYEFIVFDEEHFTDDDLDEEDEFEEDDEKEK